MSEAESPQRSAAGHNVTVEDVRQLMGASTPHFALQLSARIAKLIAKLPADDPARILGEQEIRRLEDSPSTARRAAPARRTASGRSRRCAIRRPRR